MLNILPGIMLKFSVFCSILPIVGVGRDEKAVPKI